MLNAFCRVAPSVRFKVRAMLGAGLFFLARAFIVRICSAVQAWRFDFFGILFSPVARGGVCSCALAKKEVPRGGGLGVVSRCAQLTGLSLIEVVLFD